MRRAGLVRQGPAPVPWKARFLAKVGLPDESGCMPWLAGQDGNGYGRFGVSAGDIRFAHQVAYAYWVGPIPAGLVIDHLCSNKVCCSPEHLDPVTIGTNVQRYYQKIDQCRHGHDYTPENTMTHHGRRECRACSTLRQRARRVGVK